MILERPVSETLEERGVSTGDRLKFYRMYMGEMLRYACLSTVSSFYIDIETKRAHNEWEKEQLSNRLSLKTLLFMSENGYTALPADLEEQLGLN
jgi:hypothetical protein